ncbi:phosphotransferase family protein [Paenibacillus sp. JDR-2]|uniref:phosphotransferase family protein n=1 Tax=Paenibacillus sp. (strain JDR-2) TaxID=324057 RepID=UPI000166A43C|nr:phosphotransferase [Paenibacillus sp. JDR-2]ACT00447.1 aminoglycoside phosphotransferase [Paenibacillus sp. JDR-2]
MIKPGACVGTGGCAEVYEWGDDRVLKLFRSDTTREAVSNEFRSSMVAWEAGLPAVRPYELMDYEGSCGIIYEKLAGRSIKERLFAPEHLERDVRLDVMDSDVRVMARMLHAIHQIKTPAGLNGQKDDLKRSIAWPAYLSNGEKQRVFAYLDSLPDGDRLCHGDPNPGNFMIHNGNPVMIDWMNATVGNPLADIAEFILIFIAYVWPPETPASLKDYFQAHRSRINDIFLDEYKRLSGVTDEEIDAWILPVAARKLSADALQEEEKKHLTAIIREKLSRIGPDTQLYK